MRLGELLKTELWNIDKVNYFYFVMIRAEKGLLIEIYNGFSRILQRELNNNFKCLAKDFLGSRRIFLTVKIQNKYAFDKGFHFISIGLYSS